MFGLVTLNSLVQTRTTFARNAAVLLSGPQNGIFFIVGMALGAVSLRGVALELVATSAAIVDRLRYGFQVFCADASRRAAQMVNGYTIGYRSICQLVSEAVGQHCSASPAEYAVAGWEKVGYPYPAFTRLVYLRPEPFLRCADDLFRAKVNQRVAMPLPTAVVHSTPTALIDGFRTIINGACHA